MKLLCVALPLTLAACMDGLEPLPVRPASELRSLAVDGHDRQFHLVPGRTASTPRPLLLVYHGSGDAAYNIMVNTGVAMAAEKAGFIAAFPDAVDGYNARWATNPVDLGIVDDLAFSHAIVDAIDAELRVDRQRIYAIGYSRGGDLVYQMACREPTFLRAGVAIAATLLASNQEWCESTMTHAVQPALLTILGSVDPIMPWDGVSTVRKGAIETGAFFAARNGCRTGAPSEVAHPAYSGFQVTRFVFDPCTKSDVQVLRVSPLRHDWPSRAFEMEPMLMQWMSAQPTR